MHRRRVANGVRSDIPCQQCRRSLGGLGHQKAIQVNEDFLGSDIVSTSGATCLKKCLKPKGQRTAKKTGCHSSSFLGPEHRHLSKSFQIRLGIDESRIDAAMAKDVGAGDSNNCFPAAKRQVAQFGEEVRVR